MTKTYKNISLFALVSSLTLSGISLNAEDKQDNASNLAAIETFGWMVAQQSVVQMEFNEEELAIFHKGFEKGVKEPGTAADKQAELQAMGTYLQARMDKIRERENEKQMKASEGFFTNLAENDKIQKAESGLYFEIIEPGEATRATAADSVKVHYKGTLIDGTVFDSSYDRGEPATFPVSGVVPGFAEGVQLVGKGGKAKLYIPSNLGYGEQVRPGGPIPPNATLIFEIEMIEVIAAKTPETPAAE